MVACCILSKFYIKPQRLAHDVVRSFVVSYRNSTSNHNGSVDVLPGRPVVSYRNSTSNHNPNCHHDAAILVVSYRNSTSNHNRRYPYLQGLRVVSYRNSTSNHNNVLYNTIRSALYLIEILHQTTTYRPHGFPGLWLYLIEILHQTTT